MHKPNEMKLKPGLEAFTSSGHEMSRASWHLHGPPFPDPYKIETLSFQTI